MRLTPLFFLLLSISSNEATDDDYDTEIEHGNQDAPRTTAKHSSPKASSASTEEPWPEISFPDRSATQENWNDFWVLFGICIVGVALAAALLGCRIRDYMQDWRLEKKRSAETTAQTSGDGVIDRATTQVSAETYKPFRIPARDIRFQGPLKVRPSFDGDQSHRYKNTSSNSPPPDDYIFDPNLNEAAEIGSGVEIIEECSAPTSQMSTVYGTSTIKSSISASSIVERLKKKKSKNNSNETIKAGLKPVPKHKGGKLRRKLSV